MRTACLENGVGRADNHVVVRSGMPLKKFQAASAPELVSRLGWNKPDRPKVVLMLAAFEPRKRQEAFLRALSAEKLRAQNMCIVFAGQGARLDASRRLAVELGIDEHVRFLGHDPHPEELIALADLCLLTSEREGLPRVVVQYLAGGKPVIVSHLPGIEEIVKDGVNGVVTPADDLKPTADAMFRLCDDPQALKALAEGARETDVSAWELSNMGEGVEAAYREAVRRKRRLPAK